MNKPCPVCTDNGKSTTLQLYQISLTEAIYLCKDRTCIYPLGKRWEIVKRNILEDLNDNHEFDSNIIPKTKTTKSACNNVLTEILDIKKSTPISKIKKCSNEINNQILKIPAIEKPLNNLIKNDKEITKSDINKQITCDKPENIKISYKLNQNQVDKIIPINIDQTKLINNNKPIKKSPIKIISVKNVTSDKTILEKLNFKKSFNAPFTPEKIPVQTINGKKCTILKIQTNNSNIRKNGKLPNAVIKNALALAKKNSANIKIKEEPKRKPSVNMVDLILKNVDVNISSKKKLLSNENKVSVQTESSNILNKSENITIDNNVATTSSAITTIDENKETNNELTTVLEDFFNNIDINVSKNQDVDISEMDDLLSLL